jgi:hypothetical protein
VHLSLTATGADSGVPLFVVNVDEDGTWSYQSRAVAHAAGTLTPGDRAQLKNFYDKVSWGLEVLNNPVSAEDRTFFRLEVDHGGGEQRQYQFSEAMNHLSWQFRDLVHFLRHNVATGGEPVGRSPYEGEERAPAFQ